MKPTSFRSGRFTNIYGHNSKSTLIDNLREAAGISENPEEEEEEEPEVVVDDGNKEGIMQLAELFEEED